MQLRILDLVGQRWRTLHDPILNLTEINPTAYDNMTNFMRISLMEPTPFVALFYFLFVKVPWYLVFFTFCILPMFSSIFVLFALIAEDWMRDNNYLPGYVDVISAISPAASISVSVVLFLISSSLTVYWARITRKIGAGLLSFYPVRPI